MIRRSKAKHSLEKLSFKVKYVIKKNQKKYIKVLNEIIINAATHDMISSLLYRWKNSLIFIQRNVKRLLTQKKIGMALKLLQWEKIEKNMLEQSKKNRKSGYQSTLPMITKEIIIKKYLAIRAKQYCIKCNEYKMKVEEIIKNYGIMKQKSFYKVRRPATMEFPEKPKPDYNFTKKDFQRMIKNAIKVKRKSQIILKALEFN